MLSAPSFTSFLYLCVPLCFLIHVHFYTGSSTRVAVTRMHKSLECETFRSSLARTETTSLSQSSFRSEVPSTSSSSSSSEEEVEVIEIEETDSDLFEEI